jgi:hypothetical protein
MSSWSSGPKKNNRKKCRALEEETQKGMLTHKKYLTKPTWLSPNPCDGCLTPEVGCQDMVKKVNIFSNFSTFWHSTTCNSKLERRPPFFLLELFWIISFKDLDVIKMTSRPDHSSEVVERPDSTNKYLQL